MEPVIGILMLGAVGWLGWKWWQVPRVWRGEVTWTSRLGFRALYLIHDRSYLTGLLPITWIYIGVIVAAVDVRNFTWVVGVGVALYALQVYVNGFNRPRFLVPPVHRERPGTVGLRRARLATLQTAQDGLDLRFLFSDKAMAIDATSVSVKCTKCHQACEPGVQDVAEAVEKALQWTREHNCPRLGRGNR
ncbi:hypothetical protein Rhe02_59090 [Rhizocola hellebori]|uniref:Uncharacterized protein n=1 Tax=Rhizocola hellebori TaxID=1392758 RepID=A0A8J3VIX0_9ACTN|nr:hypothetical protein [Rhizocola hellebori]GIH07842.1 hypothetical protein Rhe02_59090 [Rhizocola hellebori]